MLINRHPLLFADLQGLGLSHSQVDGLAGELCTQLGGSRDFNLCYVLAALNRADFMRAVDISAIADRLSINPALAQAAVMTIAPWVDRFRLTAV